MYAVVGTGGKQYKVQSGDVVRVECLSAQPGDMVDLDDVKLIFDDDSVVSEKDALEKAKVTAKVLRHGRARKIKVFKSKRRKGYRRTQGHRQDFTELQIQEVSAG